MKIIKRNCTEAVFDINKIVMAVTKANKAADEKVRLTPLQIQRISQHVEIACEEMGRSPSVEEIQDLVEKSIMAHGAFEVAKEYITYRYTRSLLRQSNTTDDRILSLIECNNEEVKQENANKNPTVTIWQVRFPRISPTGFCCRRKLWRPMKTESSISMTPIIMPSICTIVTW